ncbi:MAG TPA: hypothetical protein VNK95_17630 [Caldilineaceae bacterium]|nr:hypothetical protein [Caldilineaceae bacterium]
MEQVRMTVLALAELRRQAKIMAAAQNVAGRLVAAKLAEVMTTVVAILTR